MSQTFTEQFSALTTDEAPTPVQAPPKKRRLKVKNHPAHAPAEDPISAPKVKRTFDNLNLTEADKSDRFKKDDVCDRCQHTFSRGMVKKFHYASKNCKEGKPYSATDIGRKGKEGQHAKRKVKKTLGLDYEDIEKELTAITQFLSSDFCDPLAYEWLGGVDYTQWTSVIDFITWSMAPGDRGATTLIYDLDRENKGVKKDCPLAKRIKSLFRKITITIERPATKITFAGHTITTAVMELPEVINIWSYFVRSWGG
jgi:hypothetical protein